MGAEGPGEITVDGEEKMKNKILFFLTLPTVCYLLSTVLGGCGYTTRSMISDKYRTIYITPFVNKIDITREADSGNQYKIYRPHLETDVTVAITNRYLFDGNLKPVKKENADLVLKGEVVEYRKDPLRYDEGDEVTEYRMNLLVNISLWDTKDNKMLWEVNNFTGYFDYYTDKYPLANVQRFSSTDDQVPLDKALDDLARRVVERTVNEW